MTDETDLLPAAPWLGYDPERGDLHGFSHDEVRVIVAHFTAARDAKIEALRKEVERQERLKEKYISQSDGWEHRAIAAETRAERLEEALRDVMGW